jgi:hypothetical protein
MAEPARDLTVTGDLAGEYSGDEELPDGSLAIRADTSAAAIRRRAGLEQISADGSASTSVGCPLTARGLTDARLPRRSRV